MRARIHDPQAAWRVSETGPVWALGPCVCGTWYEGRVRFISSADHVGARLCARVVLTFLAASSSQGLFRLLLLLLAEPLSLLLVLVESFFKRPIAHARPLASFSLLVRSGPTTRRLGTRATGRTVEDLIPVSYLPRTVSFDYGKLCMFPVSFSSSSTSRNCCWPEESSRAFLFSRNSGSTFTYSEEEMHLFICFSCTVRRGRLVNLENMNLLYIYR